MGHVDLQNGIWIICTKCLIYCTQDHDFVGLLYVSDVWAVEHLAILKVVDENMPQIHVSSNTRAIIDCTEIKCQMSSSLLYAGSISGWLITWRSRFLDLFEANDSIMVDKGFNIQNLLPGVVPLKIPPPPFLRSSAQMPTVDVVRTQEIVFIRIYMEKAINKVKNFDIWDSMLPLSVFGIACG